MGFIEKFRQPGEDREAPRQLDKATVNFEEEEGLKKDLDSLIEKYKKELAVSREAFSAIDRNFGVETDGAEPEKVKRLEDRLAKLEARRKELGK